VFLIDILSLSSFRKGFIFVEKKKVDKQPTDPLYCYVKECDFKFIKKMLMVKKIPKVLEFNHLE